MPYSGLSSATVPQPLVFIDALGGGQRVGVDRLDLPRLADELCAKDTDLVEGRGRIASFEHDHHRVGAHRVFSVLRRRSCRLKPTAQTSAAEACDSPRALRVSASSMASQARALSIWRGGETW